MFPKIIKTEAEYEATVARIEELLDADPGTAKGDELELLATLVELYETAAHPIDLPDPIEAVKFRMEQGELKQKDLVPFIGSRSKVSEVLSGQRPLSLPMIRKLHQGLGIPAEVLLQEPGAAIPEALEGVEWSRFPLAEMLKRGWFPDFEGTLAAARKHVEDLLTTWAAPLGQDALQPVLLRQHVRSGSETDSYALSAWRIRITLLALDQDLPAYRPGTVSQDFVRDLLRLSYLDNGPLLAREYLLKSGIHFVIEPHLSHTHLDGAALKMPDGSPLVALTLRHDRLDNFWFTLCHELAHIALHFDGEECEVFLTILIRPNSMLLRGMPTAGQAKLSSLPNIGRRPAWDAIPQPIELPPLPRACGLILPFPPDAFARRKVTTNCSANWSDTISKKAICRMNDL